MVFPHRPAGCAAGLLPFRYIDGTCLSGFLPATLVAMSAPGDGRSKSGLHATCAVQVGQSQRPVSGTGSIRRSNRRVTEPESRAVVDDTPGVQLAAILTLNPYGPVIDGHRVRG
jgi:hypothetical protein